MGASRVFLLCLVGLLALGSVVAVSAQDDDWQSVTEFLESDTSVDHEDYGNDYDAPQVSTPVVVPNVISAEPTVDTSDDAPEVDQSEELAASADTEVIEDAWANEPNLEIAVEDPELEVAQVAALPPFVSASSPCANQGGTCKSTASGCGGGSFHSGLCPGAANIKCCKKAAAPASPCSNRGGQCKATNTGCSGTFQSGLCPGAANVKCCLNRGVPPAPHTPASSSCGPYAGAPVQNIKGNGGRNYGVVFIARQHSTNPGKYGANPTTTDNTMTVSTACAFNAMWNAARGAGVTITISSGFRTLARQQYFWNCYRTKRCNNGNLAAAPGTSNHGIGLALDLNASGRGVYTWLRNHAHKFGFVRTVARENWHWEHRVGWRRAPYT